MPLPEPTLSFTIPSIHDDITLDCRIYHPFNTSDAQVVPEYVNIKRGAIVAHPYAPLGGCYNDPVMGIAGEQILEDGYILCTFNFRGASGSKGGTTWTGKAERDDYVSVAGLFMYYLHHLDLSCKGSPISRQTLAGSAVPLILGGYSYGSHITVNLPRISEILCLFNKAIEGISAWEIKLRARSLAEQMSEKLRALDKTHIAHGNHAHNTTLTVGGEETSPDKRRPSGETRRSLDIKRSLDLPKTLSKFRRKSFDTDRQDQADSPINALEHEVIPQIASRYLLISPLLPPISSLTTLPWGSVALKSDTMEQRARLSECPTLAIFGDDDSFTSIKKLKKWATAVQSEPDSRFKFYVVEHAGHFWHDAEAQKNLKQKLSAWLKVVL